MTVFRFRIWNFFPSNHVFMTTDFCFFKLHFNKICFRGGNLLINSVGFPGTPIHFLWEKYITENVYSVLNVRTECSPFLFEAGNA